MGRKKLSAHAFFLAPLVAADTSKFLSSTIGSNMVLQRDAPSSIYGWTEAPNTTVECSINGVTYKTMSSFNSSIEGTFDWTCSFPSFPGSFDEYVINVTAAETGQFATLENVVFGDVFMCSGQSNMEFSMPGMFDADTEIAAADDFPFIRVLSVGIDYDSPDEGIPQDDLYSLELPWAVGSTAVMADNDDNAFDYFSSVCYETGKYIYSDLLNSEIPIGLVSSNWGGTTIETWMPEGASQACGESNMQEEGRSEHFLENPDQRVGNNGDDGEFYTSPAINYNNMIWPFREMVFKAVVWYQAESNTGINTDIYACLQNNMMDAWRGMPGFSDVPLLYVQLAPWAAGGTTAIADMRWAQYTCMDNDKNSFMVSAADLGDPDSPEGDIHPRNKMEVARRLSLAAGTALYSQPVPHMGPIPLLGQPLDDGSFGAYIKFDSESIGDGLNLQDPQACPDEDICGYHYLVYPTAGNVLVDKMVIDGDVLNMYPAETQTEKPTAIQYGYCDYPLMTIYNSYNTPLMPFEAPLPFPAIN